MKLLIWVKNNTPTQHLLHTEYARWMHYTKIFNCKQYYFYPALYYTHPNPVVNRADSLNSG